MTANCSSLGLSDVDFCLPIQIVVDSDEFTIDKAWIAGAFILGLIVGAVLTALCVRPFLASWEKKKRQDEEETLLYGGTVAGTTVAAEPIKSGERKFQSLEILPIEHDSKKTPRKKSSRFKRKKKVKDADAETQEKVEVDEALCRGMADVLSQTNGMAAEVEMAEQDMSAIVAMERSQEQEKETLLLKVLEQLLKKKAAKRMVTNNFCDNFIKKTEGELVDTRHMLDREKEEEEEKLKNDNKLSKDPQALESELQALQTKFNHKQGKLQRDYKEKIRSDLIKSSGMSEEEVEGVMEKLMAQMSNLEDKLGREQNRQRRALEERLAKRRQVVDYMEETEKAQEETRSARVDSMRKILSQKVMDGQLLEQQNDELVAQYEGNLFNLYDGLNKEFDLSWGDLSAELQKIRMNEMTKLMEKQAQERAMFNKKVDASSNIPDIVKSYHELLSRQHSEQEALSQELDGEESQKKQQALQDMEKAEERASKEEAERLLESLQSVADISSKEADRILKVHKQTMEAHEARQQQEKMAMMQRLQEKLNQRLTTASEAEARDAQEQKILCEEQAQTMQKVLDSNIDLDEDAKEKILKQHEQNMQALSNQLQRSKMRQQKSLEMKLNQRRARIMELKDKQEETRKRSRQMNEKEREKLEAELESQIMAEEQKLEEARQAAVAELRRQLAAETAAALKAHDEEIGLLIARMQVGQARRKAILERQDKTLKELQDQLETKVAGAAPGTVTDQLLQQHYNNVEHMNQNRQRRREVREKQVEERIKALQRKKEQEIEVQLESDAQQEYTEQQHRGAGYASLALMQTFLEQKHQRAMSELETQMTAELEKEKDEINQHMELELQKELQEQRQNLLNQLAAVSNLSHQELEDAVDAAVSGKQSEKQAKRLAKDLKQGIDRAKTSMHMDYGGPDREGLDMRRARSNLEAGDFGKQPPQAQMRPASGKRFMMKKPAFGNHVEEDDDDF